MPIGYGSAFGCADVPQFNTELLAWLASTTGPRLGDSYDQYVATVPIGRERCVLRGTTRRDGVAEYLRRALGGSAPFFVVPGSDGVNHRVTVEDGSSRIPGFYLYTSRPIDVPNWVEDDEQPVHAFAAADGSAFGWQQVVLKIMDSVALLHARGHQRLRVRLTEGDLGFHVMVTLAERSGEFSSDEWGATLLAYSSANGPRVGSQNVRPDTRPETIAREILAQGAAKGVSDMGIGIDWAYAGWLAELIAEARRHGLIPRDNFYAHWADFPDPGPRSWELGYSTGLAFPPPPRARARSRAGFTDAFPEPKASPASDVTKQINLQALVAAFTHPRGGFIGLYAFTPDSDYRRELGSWVRYERDDDIRMDTELVEVNYRFIKTYDVLEKWSGQDSLPSYGGEYRDWWGVAEQFRVLGREPALDDRNPS